MPNRTLPKRNHYPVYLTFDECDEDLVRDWLRKRDYTAGILHDVVEDTSVTIEQVERLFGKRVADMVKGASEPEHLRNGKDAHTSWQVRKQHTIAPGSQR